jgi:Cd2+/Zn2+-exporting ATPase
MEIKRDYQLSGVNCFTCAGKIEADIRKIEGIKEANLNFPLSKLHIELTDEGVLNQIEERIQNIMDSIERGSKLLISNLEDSQEQEAGLEDAHRDVHGLHGGIKKINLIFFILAAALYFTGIFFVKDSTAKLIIFLITYLIFGHEVLVKSVRNILKGKIFDENFLMSIASIGAFFIGEHAEAAAVMMFYQVGEMFQDYALDNSRSAIKSLVNIKPQFANLKTEQGYEKVNPTAVREGDYIIIRPGERVPLDGIVTEGISTLDTSTLTGESLPRDISPGGKILSGSINMSGMLTVKVTSVYENSTVKKILTMVEHASQKKAPTERFITRFAAWYTPAVVGIAAMLAIIPPLFFHGHFNDWLYRALVFLVVSCPCALVISIPLGFFGGIGAASKRGILVKGGNYLEALAKARTMVFDKTGTLTKGSFEVTEVRAEPDISENELIYYAAHAEGFSTHPLALAIIKKYGDELDKSIVSDYSEHAGMGISAKVENKNILLGNSALLEKFVVPFIPDTNDGTIMYVAIDGKYSGSIQLEDTIKEGASNAINDLQALGVENIVMLTGDRKGTANKVASKLGINKVHAELLPHEKVEHLEKLVKNRKKNDNIVFIGDGINDSPVIARADVGIAMGETGSDAAIEAADVVIMTDELERLPEAIRISRKTKTIVYQNIALAMIIKVIVLFLGAGGLASMWEAVFADVGVALLAILNAMRIVKVK